MKEERILNVLGKVDEKYIKEADPEVKSKRKAPAWTKWVAMAACLSLIIAGGLFGNIFHSPDTPDVPENNIMSFFAITAHAANGETKVLNVSDSFVSSGEPKYNMFGHNIPLFSFDVEPSDLKSNEAVYQRFDISISYNGTPVKNKDEHIMVAYLASAHTSQTYGYTIFGWFTEPTDVVVTIADKESKAVVEEMTVNVKYDANRQEYELKLTNLDTEYAK